MSHFANYIKERQNKEIIEDENGFATYYFAGPDCYIEDIYVVPEKRKSGVAAKYADKISKIAQEKNCLNLIGSVKPTANGSTASLKVLLAYGFKLYSANEDFIWFKKKLEV
jgi:predicted GNAT family acetyltransferase